LSSTTAVKNIVHFFVGAILVVAHSGPTRENGQKSTLNRTRQIGRTQGSPLHGF
jgi:hypothetical protein